ncbi:MAG: type IV secretory system conjugative DNA transfer family protein [Devosia sp.]|nr:type IV secretory system conjugative DNA transfer family protein [Devosia sp.]
MNLLVSAERRNATTQPLGTASWLNTDEAVPAYRTGDLWLGREPNHRAVGYNDDRHVLLVSGTRSGKGVSVIIPNLCLWPGSVVVIDPKGENAMVTARRRGKGSSWSQGMGQRVHIFDPFGEVKTAHDDFADLRAAYNPIDLIRTYPADAVDDAARMAEALIVSENTSEPFFDDSAKNIVKSLILHIASANYLSDEARNLLTLRHMLVAGDDSLGVLTALNGSEATGMAMLFRRMQDNPAYGGVVSRSGAMLEELLESSPRTLMSVLQVARTNTDFLDSPKLQSSLSHSTFALRDLKQTRTSLYLCLPQRYMASHYRWLRMMVTLILGEMERTPKQNAQPVLMVLDEFPALKRMTVIENAAAQIAGYGVKLMFVAQTLAQLKDIYKDNWETLVANAGIKLFFGNDDHFTREYAAKLIGETETRRWASTASITTGHSQTQTTGMQIGLSANMTKGRSSSSGFSGSSFSANSGISSSRTLGISESQTSSQGHTTNQSRTEGVNESVHKRYLITPDEIGRLFGDRSRPAMLVLMAGKQPLALRRAAYYSDAFLAGRFDPHKDHAPPKPLAQIISQRQEQAAKAERQKRIEQEIQRERQKQREWESSLPHAVLAALQEYFAPAFGLWELVAEVAPTVFKTLVIATAVLTVAGCVIALSMA